MNRVFQLSLKQFLASIFLISSASVGLGAEYGPYSLAYSQNGAQYNVSHNGRDRGHHRYEEKPWRHHSNQRHQSDYVYGKVIHARPIFETRISTHPTQSCWNEPVTYRHSDSSTGAILGGIIGAAVGHELGHEKRNKQVGAIAGAVLGSSIGHDISRKGGKQINRVEQKCQTVYNESREQVIVGYQVKYRLNGRIHRTRLDYDPGEYIKLYQSLQPVR